MSLVKEFESELILEGSWGHKELGPAKNKMTLHISEDGLQGWIEWEAILSNGTEEWESIGVWFEGHIEGNGNFLNRYLKDYDGIQGFLPVQAAELLEENGIEVDRSEFCE